MADDAADNSDSVDSGADSYNDSALEPAADSDPADNTDSATDDQEDQFNAP